MNTSCWSLFGIRTRMGNGRHSGV